MFSVAEDDVSGTCWARMHCRVVVFSAGGCGRARSLAYESMKQPKCIEDGVPGYWEANSGSHCGVQSNSSLSLLWLVACISVL